MRGLLDPQTFGSGAAGGLHGGALLRIQNGPGSGIGGNGPPPEAEEIPQAEPDFAAPRVPQGWDIPAHVVDGVLHPAVRRPVLPSGQPWPVATHDAVKAQLAPQGRTLPSVTLLVPQDGVGPMLLGNNEMGDDFAQPSGYSAVRLYGTPQVNPGHDRQTERYDDNGHADDSIQEAFRLAQTHQFSTIFFNRGYTRVTDGWVKSLRRPDVFAVALPQFSDPYRYRPYESFSKGQKPEDRQKQLPDVPGIARVYGTEPENWKKNPDKE